MQESDQKQKIDIEEEYQNIIEKHIEVGNKYGELVTESKVFTTLDTYLYGILNRSCSTAAALQNLYSSKNFISSAAVLRFQLDNLLRFHALFLSENVFTFVASVIQGKAVGNMQDKDGKRMKDFYLREKLSNDIPWLDHAYKTCSGYIHFSDAHIANAMQIDFGSENHVKSIPLTMKVSPVDSFVTIESYVEILTIYNEAFHALLAMKKGFEHVRQHHFLQ